MAKKVLAVEKWLPYILLIGGGVGFIASFLLSVEKVDMLQNPHYKPICNINPLFSCVSVANTHQAAVFGPPNTFIGIGAFAAVITVAMVMLSGAQLRAWFWRLFNLGLLAGMLFVIWLMFQSIYIIGALCIYCMSVWIAMALIFWYTTLYNFKVGHMPTVVRLRKAIDGMIAYHDIILASWYALIIFAILQHFWQYFRTIL